MNFFSFNFPLREYFFGLRPPPHKFSNGPSLSISRQNGYAKQNIILLHFLANEPRREPSGIRKKRKTVYTQGTIRENAELSPARQSITGNHHIHSKYVLW